ncbi:MAG TPA: AMP-binding protein [Solirubrobacteraceae bacterium]|jgi:O-succinylbenzoic acid--CoA ligase|nr:AMP-binding protein [Solirubrobacteraceae bacterium]
MAVTAWLQRAAATRPHALAVAVPGNGKHPARSCTYAELLALARAGADHLAARGAAPGERVAIALPAGLDFACALHACLLLGAVAVPVDPRLGPRERAAILDGAAVVVEEPLPAVPHVPSGSWLASKKNAHNLDAVAAVIHTSGTTSAPKPVELTYGNFLWSALGSAVALGLDPDERWLCNLPLSHVGGLSILLRSAIYGTTAVVHERFDTELTLRALTAPPGEAVTLVSLVATTLARLLDAGLESPSALRCALTGGGPVPAALLARAHDAGVPVSLTYGLTEACSQVTTLPLAVAARAVDTPGGPPTAGPPLFCTRVRTAADGEIEVCGPTVARGAAGADGWLRTGDLGTLTAEGGLVVTGRKADTIVSGGENVAPTEVEAALEEHPGVLEAAALARADERWGEAVTALVVARPGAQLLADPRSVEELRRHCAARLAPYKVPKEIALVEGPLPRTRSGKLLRRELTHE